MTVVGASAAAVVVNVVSWREGGGGRGAATVSSCRFGRVRFAALLLRGWMHSCIHSWMVLKKFVPICLAGPWLE